MPPFIPAVCPEVADYQARFAGSNGTIKTETLQALDRFVRTTILSGVWSKLLEVYPFCGDTLNGAMVKLKRVSAITPDLTAANLVAGDYTERGTSGGIAGNGTTKYIDTNFTQNQLAAASFLAVYLRETETANPKCWMGANSATDWSTMRSASATQSQVLLGGASVAAAPVDLTAGLYAGDRSSNNRLDVYKNGVTTANNAGAVAPAYSANNLFVLARNNAGVAAEWTAKRIGFAALGTSMTAAEHLAFYNAVQNLMTELGRNV